MTTIEHLSEPVISGDLYLTCCGIYVAYPTSGHSTECFSCGTVFVLAPLTESE